MPVAELKSVLSNDNKPFMKSMDEATAKGKKTGKEIEKGFNPLKHVGSEIAGGFAGALGVGAVIEFTKSIVEMGSELQDAADRLDLSTDALQGLGYAFGQSGAKQEDFEKGMIKLNEAIAKGRDDDQNTIDTFAKLGVTFDDIRKKNPEEILYEIADGMKDAKDPTEALAAAMELLGKSGAKLLPGLKLGANGLIELSAEVMKTSKEDIAALDDLGDAMARFTQNAKVLGAKALLGAWRGIGAIGAQEFQGGDFPAGYKGSRAMAGDVGFVNPNTRGEGLPEGMQLPRGRKLGKEEEEAADERNKQERETEEFVAKNLEQRQRSMEEIRKITEDTWYLERDTGRIGMSSQELIVDLEKERVHWLREAERLESDVFGLHQKDAALARQRVAKITQQIAEVPTEAEPEQKMTGGPRGRKLTKEDEMLADFGAFKDFQTGPFSGGGGLTTGGLTSGGLNSGGLNGGAGHVIRRGDAAAAKAAEKQAKDDNKGIESRLDTIAGLLQTSSAPNP